MRKSPNQRTQDDVTTIKQYLMTIPFLRDSFQGQEQSFELLSKMFRLEIFEENETIFHIDSKGEKYYLILQGSVGIYIRPPKQMTKQIKKQKQQKKKEDDISNKNNEDNQDKSEELENWQLKQNLHLQQLVLVKQLTEGQTFGEMALIYNKPRLATTHSISQTILAVLTKRDFRLIMKKAEMRQIKGELKFFKQVYFFQSWNYEMLRDIYLNSEQIQIQYGQNIFIEDDQADAIYIIKKGSFLVKYSNFYSPAEFYLSNLPIIPIFIIQQYFNLKSFILTLASLDYQIQQLKQNIMQNQK